MVALDAHKVGAQRGGELVLGGDEANVAGARVHFKARRPKAVAVNFDSLNGPIRSVQHNCPR
eukprot:1257748-Pleurochrysis_carterae.AAC.1